MTAKEGGTVKAKQAPKQQPLKEVIAKAVKDAKEKEARQGTKFDRDITRDSSGRKYF